MKPTKTTTTKYFKDSASGYQNEMITDAATFVHNCECQPHGKNYEGLRIFKADILTMEKAKQLFVDHHGEDAVPFFAVHGFDNEPVSLLNGVKQAQEDLDELDNEVKSNCQIVPVLWPNYGWKVSPAAHRKNKANSSETEVEINKMLDQAMVSLNVFPKKNLMCHSMGNFLLRREANDKLQFDNIFMVAAVSSFLSIILHVIT